MAPTCIDLRSWANTHRYRWRWEESRQAGEDDPFLVEIPCKRGLIYPKGGDDILAFTVSFDAWRSMLEIGVKPKRVGDKEREGMFPVELLDQVAAILRPKRLPGSAELTPEQLANLRKGQIGLQSAMNQGPKTAPEPTLTGLSIILEGLVEKEALEALHP